MISPSAPPSKPVRRRSRWVRLSANQDVRSVQIAVIATILVHLLLLWLAPRMESFVGREDMGRTPTLVRIVADLGSLLPAIEGFDGGVHIQNPRLIQQGLIGKFQVLPLPRLDPFRRFLFKSPPQRILADHFAHPQEGRIDRVVAQGRHAELLAREGAYRAFFEAQFGEDETPAARASGG